MKCDFDSCINGEMGLPAYEDIPWPAIDAINALERMRLNEDPDLWDAIEDFQVLLWELRKDEAIAEDVEAALYDRYCRRALSG